MLITLRTTGGNQIAIPHFTIGYVGTSERGTLIKNSNQGEGEAWYSEFVSESLDEIIEMIASANRSERTDLGGLFGN